MIYFISSFFEVFSIFKKDKIIILFSFFPIFIGIIVYYFFGRYFITFSSDYLNKLMLDFLGAGLTSGILEYVVMALLNVFLYIVFSFTFVLFVSIIASPFNDIISERTSIILKNLKQESLSNSWNNFFKKLIYIIKNEIKKILFIMGLMIISTLLGFIPILTIISFVLSSLLISITFLDYSWSRYDVSFRDCILNLKKNLLVYTISGGVFLVLISVPIINLLVLPYAVVYFTILYEKNITNLKMT